jgi:hypothetical protein
LPDSPSAACRTNCYAMAPKGKKETDFEKSRRLSQLSFHLSGKADFAVVVGVMKRYPQHILTVETQFINLGLLTPDGAPVENPVASALACQLFKGPDKKEDQQSLGDDSSVDHGLVDCQDAKEVLDTDLHRNFATWGNCPPGHLKNILDFMEPASLSKHSVKALIAKGCKEPPRDKMLELLERMTDDHAGLLIGDQRNLKLIATNMQEKNMMNGRPLRDVVLPVDWETSPCRVYDLEITNNSNVSIRMLGSSDRIELNEYNRKDLDTVFSFGIENNYSKLRATFTVYDANTGDVVVEAMNIGQLFAVKGLSVQRSMMNAQAERAKHVSGLAGKTAPMMKTSAPPAAKFIHPKAEEGINASETFDDDVPGAEAATEKLRRKLVGKCPAEANDAAAASSSSASEPPRKKGATDATFRPMRPTAKK